MNRNDMKNIASIMLSSLIESILVSLFKVSIEFCQYYFHVLKLRPIKNCILTIRLKITQKFLFYVVSF